MVIDLLVDRVDLVEEGANSAAFVELYKRKEPINMSIDEILSELKQEHADIIKAKITAGDKAEQDLQKAKEDLQKANENLENASTKLKEEEDKVKALEEAKKSAGFDETETMKNLPKEAQEYVTLLKSQKIAAEEAVRKANEAKIESEAVAKAAELKSLPIENEKLVAILKGASKELVDVLTTISAAIDSTVLNEVGKSKPQGASTGNSVDPNSAWAKIEAEADKIVKSAGDTITKQKAIAEVIKSQPKLYQDYLDGGAE